ncbi:SGNH/GDSL hydrolase family protein [Frankia sp. AgB1.9]|uniref:SGNH/GDSL hydrolase family protein n=1 Tax=unclassified Frankia TaxID=2632575 RepID=UPI001934196E|nr:MULTISPECIES: SGNH/GDSL hydrolase family protein [unclassified Frankia]MBL7489957.1 SGNH/GDSL hydrolase family protein [Frankia sp. AgW1.1]MBL7552155.1 SGNH/GDSL hydrolase family protein [Frankia sp. AgB1.9]MBL7625248.1 SGNH/GDSL hydrolase family protein [Frankia sp. AgB1.8]
MAAPKIIAALGSSYAAGPGIEPVEDAAAMRSARNYAHLCAEQLGARLVDLTVSGATTETILRSPQTTMRGARFAPQIDGLPADADLVTVTAGGNDLRFVGSVLAAAWRSHDPDGVMVRMLDEMLGATGIPDPTDAEVEQVADGLAGIVDEARRRAPRSRVILVDYLTSLGDDTRPGVDVPFSAEELTALLRVQAALREAHERAAKRAGAELLAASVLSEGHELGGTAQDPWVFSFVPEVERTGASFHPNLAGMTAIADALTELLA